MRQTQPAGDAVVEVGRRRCGASRPPPRRGDGLTDEACAVGQVRPDRFDGDFDHASMLRELPTCSVDAFAPPDGCVGRRSVIEPAPMASIPPPPDQPAQPFTPPGETTPPGPSSKTTIIAILVSVAVIATIGTVVALANSGGGDASASPSAGVTGVAPIDVLTAHETSSRVTLTWTVGSGTAAARYVVSRNGSVAAALPADATQWVDRDVLPESRYRYAVRATGQDGTTSSDHVTARTKSAPLGTAPLTGVFDVHLHATSHFGFSSFGAESGNVGWRFTPTCAKGPCDTKIADLHQKDFR